MRALNLQNGHTKEFLFRWVDIVDGVDSSREHGTKHESDECDTDRVGADRAENQDKDLHSQGNEAKKGSGSGTWSRIGREVDLQAPENCKPPAFI